MPASTWTHFALVMESNVLSLYLGGVSQFAPLTITGRLLADLENLVLGGSAYGPSSKGNFDEVRISAMARYTSNFTPPTGPFPDGACILVPDVTGDDLATATAAITGAGFVVGTVSYASSGTVPAGDVISQNPVGGTGESAGFAIDLVISTGPATVAVPDLTGDTLSTATAGTVPLLA
jgi:hypothetical protein